MKRATLLVLAVALIPACGGGGGGGGGGGSFQAPPPLFSDDFSSGLGDWIVETPGIAIDSGSGVSAPSLFANAAGGTAPASARTALTFSTMGGSSGELFVWADVRPGTSNGSINIVNSANPGTIDTYASVVNNRVLFS